MKFDVNHDKLYIAPSVIPGAEYGVFAKKRIKPKEVIELAPFVEVPRDALYTYPNRLQEYAFRSHIQPNPTIIILGYGGMYNHHTHPNVAYDKYPQDPNRFLVFFAIKHISKDSELFIHYGRDPITKKPCRPVL